MTYQKTKLSSLVHSEAEYRVAAHVVLNSYGSSNNSKTGVLTSIIPLICD